MLFQEIKHLWRAWRAGTRASLVREMEFRTNFIAGLIRQLIWLGAFLFMIEVIFRNTNSLAGWEREEVLLILALSRIVEGLINTFFMLNLMRLPELVRRGQFDYYLTKPIPAQFYTAFHQADFDNLANIIAGSALLVYALIQVGLPSVGNILAFVGITASGIATYYGLLILAASLVFRLERLEFLWGFNILLSEPLTYPFNIFPRSIQVTLTYLIPIAFVVFIPAQALTGRLSWWQLPVAIGIAALFLSLANLAWRAGLRRYTSASS